MGGTKNYYIAGGEIHFTDDDGGGGMMLQDIVDLLNEAEQEGSKYFQEVVQLRELTSLYRRLDKENKS